MREHRPGRDIVLKARMSATVLTPAQIAHTLALCHLCSGRSYCGHHVSVEGDLFHRLLLSTVSHPAKWEKKNPNFLIVNNLLFNDQLMTNQIGFPFLVCGLFLNAVIKLPFFSASLKLHSEC